MTSVPAEWNATVTVRTRDPARVDQVARALRPEAAREVPRSSAELRDGGPGVLTIAIAARDSGAMRAAMNTYLGWIHLALASARVAARVPDSPPAAP